SKKSAKTSKSRASAFAKSRRRRSASFAIRRAASSSSRSSRAERSRDGKRVGEPDEPNAREDGLGGDSLAAGALIAGRYRIEGQLGQGGMGAVYLVRHAVTGERCALKVLHAAVLKDALSVSRFQREARAPALIDSDHVVRVIDADTAP